ncbi:MAG: hypothetical protein PHD33_00875 [Atribacterota bacterium]|nr:hypothetical protein [Atribacterota bacterium]
MKQVFYIFGTALFLVVIYIYIFYIAKKSKVPGKKKVLRQRCYSLLRLTPELADETIDRLLANLKQKYPNRSEEWYLEKMIYDLERDRH